MTRTHQHIVYIYNKEDKEIEVDMELLEDGFPYGIMTNDGEEVMLTSDEQKQARDAYNIKMEEYEAEGANYYGV
jgi:hypothetical protein